MMDNDAEEEAPPQPPGQNALHQGHGASQRARTNEIKVNATVAEVSELIKQVSFFLIQCNIVKSTK